MRVLDNPHRYRAQPGRSLPPHFDGPRWEADPLDCEDQQILKSGSYEPEIARHLISELRPSDVFWDIGANAGVHALHVKAARPRGDGRVRAVAPSVRATASQRCAEPSRRDGLLRRTRGRRGYRHLRGLDVGNSRHKSLMPWNEVCYTTTSSCWCDPVDDLIEGGVPASTVTKLDAEGAEQSVFAGMSGVLRSASPRHIVFDADNGDQRAFREIGLTIEPLASTGGGAGLVARY